MTFVEHLLLGRLGHPEIYEHHLALKGGELDLVSVLVRQVQVRKTDLSGHCDLILEAHI